MSQQQNMVVMCPHCDQLAQYQTRNHTHDPATQSPHDEPTAARCAGCGDYYWIEQAEEVGHYPAEAGNGDVPVEWTSAPKVVPLSETECLEAIAAGFASTSHLERGLRISAWLAGNAERNGDATPVPETDANEESPAMLNVRHLAGLIAEADTQETDSRGLITAKARALRGLLFGSESN